MAFDDIEITRYMPMPQFIGLLSQGMFIPKATLFNDELEGISRLWYEGNLSEKQEIDWAKEWTYISCWYKSFEESMAMWSIYGKYSEAIAIHTSTKKLIDLINQDSKLKSYPKRFNFISYMDHKDYPKPLYETKIDKRTNRIKRHIFANLLDEFYYKHRAFQHENEIRLCVVDKKPLEPFKPNDEQGIYVKNAIQCVDMITLAPNSPQWYVETVRDVIKKFGFNVPVCRSELDWSKDVFKPTSILF